MRIEWKNVARSFLPAYAGAVGWVLAGCGWGLVVGCALEAAFGRGCEGLLEHAGVLSLEAPAGALLGMLGGTLTLACLHLITLVPLGALMSRYGGRYPQGKVGLMHERSARSAAFAGVLCALINGTYLFPVIGAGVLLESVEGPPMPATWLEGATLAGILAGGIIALVCLVRSLWQDLPPAWRDEICRDDALRQSRARLAGLVRRG
jgi:hypothetical protein